MPMAKLADGLSNLVKNLGVGKGGQSHYAPECLGSHELLSAYRTSWLNRKLVDVPVNDALRQWRTWDSEAAREVERRIDLHRQLKAAWSAARLYGGAALFIGTNVSTVSRALNTDSETVRHLNIIPRDHITIPDYEQSLLDPNYGHPTAYDIDGQRVHPSRLCLFHGDENHDNWFGDSVLQSAYQALQSADLASTVAAELLPEAKVDVFKVPNLMQQLGSYDGEESLLRRVHLAQKGKSVANGLLIDSEEEYQQKQINFSGVNDAVLTLLQVAAGACDIPATRLIGMSASGLNASGDNEVRDYYDNLRAKQTLELTPAIANLDALIMRESGATEYAWNPLWQLGAADKAKAGNDAATAVKTLSESEVYSDDEIRTFGESLTGALQ